MGISILVVDDEEDFLETIVNRLKRRKLAADGVKTGEAAIEKIKSGNYDVVLLDVKIPGGMDGLETLNAIKKINPLTEIILLTGHASIETSIEGLKLGAFDYLLKPANFDELLTKIANASDRKAEQDHKIIKAKIHDLLHHPGTQDPGSPPDTKI